MSRLITGTRILHRALPPTVDADLFTDAKSGGGGTDLRLACNRPEKSRHLPRDCGRHDDLGLACRREPTIAGTEPTCAFQAMSRTICGSPSSRSCSLRLTRAGIR